MRRSSESFSKSGTLPESCTTEEAVRGFSRALHRKGIALSDEDIEAVTEIFGIYLLKLGLYEKVPNLTLIQLAFDEYYAVNPEASCVESVTTFDSVSRQNFATHQNLLESQSKVNITCGDTIGSETSIVGADSLADLMQFLPERMGRHVDHESSHEAPFLRCRDRRSHRKAESRHASKKTPKSRSRDSADACLLSDFVSGKIACRIRESLSGISSN